ncbi:MAG: M48 family metallopeptidase [Candidatus Parcubacteria bacterium]|nr:M48 family metallopeptidase [Burkholderiales bacterium]
MTDARALYFDGRSSEGREVSLSLDGAGVLLLRGEGISVGFPLDKVRASGRIGSSQRHLYFPDGSKCETADNDAVDRLFEARPRAFAQTLHRWESSLAYVLAAAVITVVSAFAAIYWGIPALAKQVAFSMPAATDALIGRDALAALDRFVFSPSALPPERQAALRKLHEGMAAGSGAAKEETAAYRLEFRRGGRAGANALALPAGIVVMTDELVALSQDDGELEAVLAHEIGHLRQRHVLRQLLQNSATALLVAVTMGDVMSLTSLAAAAPTLLLHAKFSRDFEREADDYAFEHLARRGIPPGKFGAILQRMDEKRPGEKDAPDFLSTHPGTRERIERARARP